MDAPAAGQSVQPSARESITCMACRVKVSDDHREHYSSDWHRVNLKRRVAGLGPISIDEFEKRVAEVAEKAEKEEKKRDKGARKAYICEVCSKRFSSEKSMEQHERSRRHIDKLREMQPINGQDEEELSQGSDGSEADMKDEEYDERLEEAVVIPVTSCLFCSAHFNEMETSIKHMAKHHGFFVPYIESLYNLEQLLQYLGEKVGVGYACVFCSKGFRSVSSAQTHMIDKNHSRMTDVENQWYDEFGEFYAWENEEDDGEWEEVEREEERAMILAAHEEGNDFVNEFGQDPVTDDTAMELILSSGARAGHRSMLRYYKQNPKPQESRDSVLLTRLIGEYRMIGNGGYVPRQANLPSRKVLEQQRRLQQNIARRQYYINKTKTNTNIAILNSGYRP